MNHRRVTESDSIKSLKWRNNPNLKGKSPKTSKVKVLIRIRKVKRTGRA